MTHFAELNNGEIKAIQFALQMQIEFLDAHPPDRLNDFGKAAHKDMYTCTENALEKIIKATGEAHILAKEVTQEDIDKFTK